MVLFVVFLLSVLLMVNISTSASKALAVVQKSADRRKK